MFLLSSLLFCFSDVLFFLLYKALRVYGIGMGFKFWSCASRLISHIL